VLILRVELHKSGENGTKTNKGDFDQKSVTNGRLGLRIKVPVHAWQMGIARIPCEHSESNNYPQQETEGGGTKK